MTECGMTFGSLFAGIGGFDLGLERAGMRCAWQVEIDPFCNRVLEKHWPKVRRYPDVKEVGPRELERVNVIAGGFPCQDLSHAGKRAGLASERSGLWFEFRRVIAALLPDWAIIENIYQAWRKWVPFVRRELWGLGYSSLPIRVRAADLGAPHIRARCFVVAHSDGELLRPERWGLEAGTGEAEPRHDGETRALADANGERQLQQERAVSVVGGWSGYRGLEDHPWASEPDVGRVAHGVPNRSHRLRGLGNAVVPQKAEWIGRRIVALSDYHASARRIQAGRT